MRNDIKQTYIKKAARPLRILYNQALNSQVLLYRMEVSSTVYSYVTINLT